jgi:hypothetical protein
VDIYRYQYELSSCNLVTKREIDLDAHHQNTNNSGIPNPQPYPAISNIRSCRKTKEARHLSK